MALSRGFCELQNQTVIYRCNGPDPCSNGQAKWWAIKSSDAIFYGNSARNLTTLKKQYKGLIATIAWYVSIQKKGNGFAKIDIE